MGDSLRREFQNASFTAAALACRGVSPPIERATLYCELASCCCRIGMASEGPPVIREAIEIARSTPDLIMRSATYASVAAAWRDCDEAALAAQFCEEARKILFAGGTRASMLQEATLGVIYGELGLEGPAQDIAAAILSRATSLPGFLSRLAMSQALRIYVALDDTRAANTVLTENLLSEREDALAHCAFDVLHATSASAKLQGRVRWITDASTGTPLAIIMLWSAQRGLNMDAESAWRKLRAHLESQDSSANALRTTCIACLALIKLNMTEIARQLFERVQRIRNDLSLTEVPFAIRCWVARVLVTFGHVPSARFLEQEGDPEEGIVGAIIEELVGRGNIGSALEIVEETDPSHRHRLVFRCAAAILKENAVGTDADLASLRKAVSAFD